MQIGFQSLLTSSSKIQQRKKIVNFMRSLRFLEIDSQCSFFHVVHNFLYVAIYVLLSKVSERMRIKQKQKEVFSSKQSKRVYACDYKQCCICVYNQIKKVSNWRFLNHQTAHFVHNENESHCSFERNTTHFIFKLCQTSNWFHVFCALWVSILVHSRNFFNKIFHCIDWKCEFCMLFDFSIYHQKISRNEHCDSLKTFDCLSVLKYRRPIVFGELHCGIIKNL